MTGSSVDEQPAGAVAVGAHHQPPPPSHRRHARHQLDPLVVAVVEPARWWPPVRVGGEHLEPPLVPRLHA